MIISFIKLKNHIGDLVVLRLKKSKINTAQDKGPKD